MKRIKNILIILLLIILEVVFIWLLYKLLCFDADNIGPMVIENIGDFLTYIVYWLFYLTTINVPLYIAIFITGKYLLERIDMLSNNNNDTMTGVDEFDSCRLGDKLWEDMNEADKY